MKLSIFITLMATILLTGCFKEDGQIGIASDVVNAIIYIDGDEKGMTGYGYTTIIIEEGDHKVRIFKERNEEWFYEGVQDVFVGANSSVKVIINTTSKPTEFRLERLAREKKAKEERLAREKKERLALAKKFGLSSYPKGIFYDIDTKLMWQDNSDARSVTKNWSGAKNYCQSLSIGEYDDWRLPEHSELLSIVDYAKYNPAIKNGFKNVASLDYWSSTASATHTSYAWSVYFYDGDKSSVNKAFGYYVRCVRGRQ